MFGGDTQQKLEKTQRRGDGQVRTRSSQVSKTKSEEGETDYCRGSHREIRNVESETEGHMHHFLERSEASLCAD